MAAGNGQLGREDWVAVARKALITGGIDDVKVDVLARRLKVTRGSFYWHFESRQCLLDALLEDWEANNRREIAALQAAEAKDGDGLIALFRVWLGEDQSFPAFDFAVRAWARKVPKVSTLVRQIDESWISLFQAHLERGGITAPESFVRARIMYFHQVGYFALAIDEVPEDRVKLARYYYSALTGWPAPPGLEEALLPVAKRKSLTLPPRSLTRKTATRALK